MLSIVGLGALFMAASVVACSNDEDNPGNPAGTAGKSAGGSSGKGGSGNAGKPSTGDAGSGDAPSGGGAAGEAPSDGGAAGQTNQPTTCDIYAERPNGVKEIPHDGEGNITTDHLTSDTIWSLAGRWFVKPDHTLTIDPCT